MAAEGELVLSVAPDVVLGGNDLGGHSQGDRRVELPHPRIDQPPSEHGVGGFGEAGGECPVTFHHHVRRPGHRLRAAGDRHLSPTGGKGVGAGDHRLHPGPAEAVDGGPGDLDGETGEETRHPGHISIVLACLVGGAPVDVLDGHRIQVRVRGQEAPDGMCREVVGSDMGQLPPELAHRSPTCVDDEDLSAHSRSALDSRQKSWVHRGEPPFFLKPIAHSVTSKER